MRVRTRRQRVAGRWPGHWLGNWHGALALSAVLHAVVLGIVGVTWVGNGEHPDPRGHVGSLVAVDTADVPTLVDLAAIDTVLPAAVVPPELAPPPPPDLAAAPAGDRTNPVVEPRAHLENGGETLRAPASDHGTGTGRPLPDRAWRRDASTLHDRLTDGAEINQPSHAQTARAAASPQAVRRETKTGTGDATRTTEHVPSATAAQYGVVDPAETGAGTRTMPGTGAEIAHSQSLATATPPPPQNVPSSARGPLDADRGRRSFDVDGRANAAAADDRATRAASDENHPSITDLTLAAVSGNSAEGRGPSDTPGAVAPPTKGTAPTPVGRRNTSDGAGDEARTQERRYNRYVQEIGSRVNQALVWPRTLAIRLEQGETIVRFVILPDGKVGDTAQVVKSSGFAEFDQAALDAVRKASPFPPMREPGRARPLSVNLPVNFSNPVIR